MAAIILLLIFIPAFWMLIVRPQQQRQKAHAALLASLAVGDRVESFSGIHGTLVALGDTTVQLEVAPDVVVTMARLAVASRLDDAEEPVIDADAPEGATAPEEGA